VGESAEMRPSNPKVLHHGKVWVLPPVRSDGGRGSGKPTKASRPDGTINSTGTTSWVSSTPAWVRRVSILELREFIQKGSDFGSNSTTLRLVKSRRTFQELDIVLAKRLRPHAHYLSPGTRRADLVIPGVIRTPKSSRKVWWRGFN